MQMKGNETNDENHSFCVCIRAFCFHAFNHLVGEIVHITRQCLCYDDAITLKFPEVHL